MSKQMLVQAESKAFLHRVVKSKFIEVADKAAEDVLTRKLYAYVISYSPKLDPTSGYMTLDRILSTIRTGNIPKPGTLPVGEYSFALDSVVVSLNEAGKARMAKFGIVSFKDEDYDLEDFVEAVSLTGNMENIDDKSDKQSSA